MGIERDNKILMFEELQDKVLDNNLENLVLFGETGFLNDGENVYDLIFHAKQTNPYSIEKPSSLVVPVLRTFNEKEGYTEIYKKHSENPEFDKFVVVGEDLNFYKVNKRGNNGLITKWGKTYDFDDGSKSAYGVIPENVFRDHMENGPNPPAAHKIIREVNEKRRVIDNKYRN